MKIRSTKHLKAWKMQLKQRQAELEKAIKYDWRDVKESLRPKEVAGQFFSKVFEEKGKQNRYSFIAGNVSQMAAKFVRTTVENVEDKILKWLKK